MTEFDVERWLAAGRKRGSRSIPKPPRLTGIYAQILDPYGVYSDLPEECQQVGRNTSHGPRRSDIWVHFKDLPKETRDALWETHKSQLAFPAGLEDGTRRGPD